MIKAFLEAERFNGPSIIIAYSPCIAHGVDMTKHHIVAKNATDSGYWPLYRFDPRLIEKNENPFMLDSKLVNEDLYKDFMMAQKRFSSLNIVNPAGAQNLFDKSKIAAKHNFDEARILSESGKKPNAGGENNA